MKLSRGPINSDAAGRAGLYVGFGSERLHDWLGFRTPGHSARVDVVTEVIAPLYVRVAAFRLDHQYVTVVSLEIVACDTDLVRRVRVAIAHAVGSRVTRVIVTASHTHTGPPVFALGDVPVHPAAREDVIRACTRAAGVAHRSLRPLSHAVLRVGTNRWAINRRLATANGVLMAPNRAGCVDQTVPVVTFFGGGDAFGSIALLPMHPTVLSPSLAVCSGDVAGAVAAGLEAFEEFGTVCLPLQGASGDVRPHIVNEDGEFRGGTIEEMQAVASGIADSCLRGATLQTLACSSLTVEGVAMSYVMVGSNRQIATEIATLVIGDQLAIVFLPGEPFCKIAVQIKGKSSYPHTLVAGHSGSTIGYMYPPKEYNAGGYEVQDAHRYYGLPGPLNPHASTITIEKAIQLLQTTRPI